MPRSTWDLRRYFWAPRLGMKGIFRLSLFRDVAVVSGAGLGGGSLGYANTLYRAPERFYADPQWSGLEDWAGALAPHYDTAERMLGVVTVEADDPADQLLREFGREIGADKTYAKTRVGVYFGTPGETVADPFFDGAGPARDRLHRQPRGLAGGAAGGARVGGGPAERATRGADGVRRRRHALAAGRDGLAAVLDAVRDRFDLAAGAEVTTEANPESTSPRFFDRLREAGYTRVSLGMQSAAGHVLAVLDRVHSAGRAPAAAAEARAAGFDHVSIDLIYGTPGERDDDLRRSVDTALEAGIDHLSAYALVVEDGTALARRVRRGEVAAPDDDVLADRYTLLDAQLSASGLTWYEVSNWSRPGAECRHNLGYWDGGEWWGAGPGAHGYLGATRWWNVKHPNTYAAMLTGNTLPVADFEVLESADRHVEDVMLRLRLRSGLPLNVLGDVERERLDRAEADGLVVRAADRVVLTDRGRLLADAVVRQLLD